VPAEQDRFPKEGGVPGSIASAAPSLVVLNAVQTEAVRFGDPGLVPRPKPGAFVLACAPLRPTSPATWPAEAKPPACTSSTHRSPPAARR
jgi:hypothetical protein